MRHCIAAGMVSLFVATALVAAPKALPLGQNHTLSVEIPEELTFTSKPARLWSPATYLLKDEEGACQVRIRFRFTPGRKPPTGAQMKQKLQTAAQRLLPNAVEEKISVQELPKSRFTIMYVELTDKRENAGDGRYMLQGLGASGQHTCQFMMLSQKQTSSAKKAILHAMASMEISRRK